MTGLLSATTLRRSDGPAAVLGAGRGAQPDVAAWLNGAAACCLELDEGNKYAAGHPAAHVVFAALAEVASATRPVTGPELLAAVVAGYEIACRFGRATRRREDLHTHGHWGATGAGAAAARVRGLTAEQIAAAADAAAGLVYATPWSVVLAGSFVRNLWAAGANVSGLVGARLAAAGLAGVEGTAGRTLGEVIGGLDPAPLTEGLGERWDLTAGYLKRHSSCSYTHPAADAVLTLRERHRINADEVDRVVVDTHRLTMPLAPLATGSRLAAMFSVPYVVAAALQAGRVGPEEFSDALRRDVDLLNLAARVEVRHDPGMDARLPTERAARVTVHLQDGRTLTEAVPNPVGDVAHHPFTAAQVHAKIAALLGDREATALTQLVDALPGSDDVALLLADLP
ncbi:MAG: MmgE/PrpD family protein [Mycobacteriaceae bacterium]